MKPNRFLLSLSIRVGLAVSLAVPFVSVQDVSPAAACSGGAIPPPAVRFDPAQQDADSIDVRDYGGIAFLGEVLDSHHVPGTVDYTWHNVRTEIALTDGVTQVVAVGPHGFGGPDCSGGPELLVGEKVMLFLYPSRGVIYCRDSFCGDWQAGQFGTPILFDGDEAYYLSWARFSHQGNGVDLEQRQYVGKSDEVLDLALDYFEINAQGREQAFQFVLGRSDPGNGPIIRPPVVGDGGLVR